MAVTKDVKIVQFGTSTGHQPTYQPVTAAASLYSGTVAMTHLGLLKNPDVAIDPADIVWGVINGIVDGNPAVSSPIVGAASNVTIAGISTGTFYLTPGTAGDALVQADVGAVVYLKDAVTVTKTDGGGLRPIAGVLASIGVAQYAGYVAVTLGNSQSSGAV